jgi:hypothetical protein
MTKEQFEAELEKFKQEQKENEERIKRLRKVKPPEIAIGEEIKIPLD